MNRTTQKYSTIAIFTWTIMLTLTSCINSRTVIRNYKIFTKENCDCITSHPLIAIGGKSKYYSKEKATCTRLNYVARRDSVRSLRNLKFQIESEDVDVDTLTVEGTRIDSMIIELKKDWTHVKIKTRWRGSADLVEPEIIKQKIRYYNKFKPFRKFIGSEKYKKGVLIKSKMKSGNKTK